MEEFADIFKKNVFGVEKHSNQGTLMKETGRGILSAACILLT
jgi:hypothetical protein